MKSGKQISCILSMALILSAASPLPLMAAETEQEQEQSFTIVNLKTDGMTDPIGLDDASPSFSWQMESSAVGAAQASYQILVSDASGNPLWDSGPVESPKSVDIPYEGEELQAGTAYSWTVAVTDEAGNTVTSEEAQFETGLMSDSIDAWDGAEFIGSDILPLDAGSLCVYRIETDLQIPEGSDSASIVFGADDFRLEKESFNIDRMAGENYVRLELDISSINKDGGAKFNIYRQGYFEGDSADTPVQTIGELEDLDAVLNEKNAHDPIHLEVSVVASNISLSVNGTELLIKDGILVNEMGQTSEYNAFPMLGSVGFAAKAGQSAVFSNYCIKNGGSYGQGTLFSETEGAGYGIFEGLDGLTVSGAEISVDGGEDGSIAWADPSFGAEPMLRTEFEAKADPVSARLYLTAHGIYYYYVNGEMIAPDEWFNPGAGEYDQFIAYKSYDLTDCIKEGGNAMGAVLGEGWWTGNMTFEAGNSNYFGDQTALLAKLVICYADGSSQTIVTDPSSWKVYNDGPVRTASFFQGEKYDAGKEEAVEGFSVYGYDDSAWEQASVPEVRAPFAKAKFYTRTDEPVHVIRCIDAKASLGESLEGSGSYVYDMGENVSGVPVISIPDELAKAGETVTIRFAEVLYPDSEEYREKGISGTLMVENYRAALVTDFYTMREKDNVFVPDLTFHGYRYVEITGLDEELPLENVQMLVLSSLDRTVSYETDNELVNRLFENICNSTTSNYISIPTDCPQRNERMGWVGDAQVFGLSASYVADSYNFMQQWMKNLVSTSGGNGMSKQFSPAFDSYSPEDESIVHKGQSFGITWNAVAVTVPYNLYMQTGRMDIVRENIENINAYMDTLIAEPYEYKDAEKEKHTEPRLTGETGTLSDHLGRVVSDGKLLGNAVFYGILNQAAALNEAVGNTEKAEEYTAKAAEVKEAWNELFLTEDKVTVNAKGEIQNTQASYATPLRYGLVSDENLPKVLENYRKTIEEPEGEDTDGVSISPYTLTTGFNGTVNLLPALSSYGLNETAYDLFESTEYASWLYPVTQGATSIWERWNSYTEENAFGGNNAMNSFNHYSLGAVLEWMMAYQLGISFDPLEPGYRHFILQPAVGGDLSYSKGSYESAYGQICSGWTAEDGAMTGYDAVVPANSSAVLYLPALGEVEAEDGIQSSGTEIHNGIETTVFELPAGSWHFDISNGKISVTAG